MYKTRGIVTGIKFPTTIWSKLNNAKDPDPKQYQETVNYLTTLYWKPVFCYIRCCGYSEEAEELAQNFFVHCFKSNLWGKADNQRGRFRNLLIVSLNNFLASEYRRRRASQVRFVSLESLMEEKPDEFVASSHAEAAFNREWKRELIMLIWERLLDHYRDTDKQLHLELFRLQLYEPFIEETVPPKLAELAGRFALPTKKTSNMINTMKRAFQRLLRHEITIWSLNEQEVDEEIRALMKSFSGVK
jgi:DNA-directed RNA polymerase specialized sigma24 family protein